MLSITLNNLINQDDDIYNNAVNLFNKLWNPDGDKKVRALCVFVSNLTNVYKEQLSLFNQKKNEEEMEELTKTLLEIKKKYGDKSITYADNRK